MKPLNIVIILIFISGNCLSEEYTEFKYASVSGKYPSFMVPSKEIVKKNFIDKANDIKNEISSKSYNEMIESMKDFDRKVVAVFLSNRPPDFSITINKTKSNNISMDDKISNFINSEKYITKDLTPNFSYSQQLLDGHIFSRVDISPAYGKKEYTQSYLVNSQNDINYTILILTEGNSYKTEVEEFLKNLRFTTK